MKKGKHSVAIFPDGSFLDNSDATYVLLNKYDSCADAGYLRLTEEQCEDVEKIKNADTSGLEDPEFLYIISPDYYPAWPDYP